MTGIVNICKDTTLGKLVLVRKGMDLVIRKTQVLSGTQTVFKCPKKCTLRSREYDIRPYIHLITKRAQTVSLGAIGAGV